MKYGLSGAQVPVDLRYAGAINSAGWSCAFSPALAYAVAWRETISGEAAGLWPTAAGVVSSDGGHGLYQLTSWVPDDWADPAKNAYYAVHDWLAVDAVRWFSEYRLVGGPLVRAIAASFNAGFNAARKAHELGDVDLITTDRYGDGVLKIYQQLLATGSPR